MFEAGDPKPEPFDWGPRKWATEEAYDEDLAAFLGDLACGRDVPEAQTRASPARSRTCAPRDGEGPIASGLSSSPRASSAADCPPAKGLPDDMRRKLEELAARATRRPSHQKPPRPIPSSKAL